MCLSVNLISIRMSEYSFIGEIISKNHSLPSPDRPSLETKTSASSPPPPRNILCKSKSTSGKNGGLTHVVRRPLIIHLNVLQCLSLRLRDEEYGEEDDCGAKHGENPEGPVLPERGHQRGEEPRHHKRHRPVKAGWAAEVWF